MNYLNNLIKDKNKLSKIKGFCNKEGTKDFISKLNTKINKNNYNTLYDSDIKISNIGFGSYLGNPSIIDDQKVLLIDI